MSDIESTLADDAAPILAELNRANDRLARRYPGDRPDRQPVHTVYGGAHLFRADTAGKLGELALRALSTHAPDAAALAAALALPGDAALHARIYERVVDKLRREAVEDFRIDFEDGYGNRPDSEEDATAAAAAREVARGMAAGTLPPFCGIRIKPLTEEHAHRAVRTLDIFVTTLVGETGGRLPDGFVVTLPKVMIEEQVSALVGLFDVLERRLGLPPGTLRLELMIETTQAIIDHDGRCNLGPLLQPARGRCTGAHFGTYDYTASCNITAAQQRMDHPACDFALHMMKVAYAGTGLQLSTGATNVMPVGDTATVHAAWRLAYAHIRHSLEMGFYQGWDLHPAQLPVRYAACYTFFLEGLDQAAERLRNFIEQAGQATLVGDVFDDAATGQGLLNYFLRAQSCGAIAEDEIATTGLSLDEIRLRSFARILAGRRQSAPVSAG
jgi:citrate lyase beta subunit